MFSKEFLTNKIPVLNLHDTGHFALSQIANYKVQHLPVANKGKYVFLISETDILSMENRNDWIENIGCCAPSVNENASILEVLQVINEQRVTVLPVVNADGECLGVITPDILIEKLNEICGTSREGAIIALEVNSHDYVLSQIIHIIEQNNAQVLNVFTYPNIESGKQVVLLKINLENASVVLRSLERFNYSIKYCSQKGAFADESMRNRINELMYYLEL
jgi:predicted transcriptional regulator